MLTMKDRAIRESTGLVTPDRLLALKYALTQLAAEAQEAASVLPKDSQSAAAMRGRKLGYYEAANMVQHIIDGHALHPRRRTRLKRQVWLATIRRDREMQRLLENPEQYFADARRHAATSAANYVASKRP